MFRLILILAILFGLYALLRWFLHSPPEVVAKRLRGVLIFVLVVLLAALALTGRLHWLFAVIGAAAAGLWRLTPVLLRQAPILLVLWSKLRGTRVHAHSGAPRRSTVRARFVSMWLDHDSGEMGGEVLAGSAAGRSLADLNRDELIALLGEFSAGDADSAALMEAYLDRRFGKDWRAGQAHAEAPPSNGSGAMTRAEACAILGIDSGASREAIIDAHRRLIQKLHPDRGGSGYLAAKINQAKDLLLK